MSSVIVDYFTPEIRTTILKKLGLRPTALKEKMVFTTDSTDFEKTNEKIISMHYNPEKLEQIQSILNPKPSLLKEIGNLATCRGKVFDISDPNNIKEVKRTFGQTINLPVNFVPLEGLLPISFPNITLQPTSGVYKPCYGGSLLCAYSWNEKERLSTFRKLDASNSHFGDSEKFTDIWLTRQDLFPSISSLPYGPNKDIKHQFIINDRKLLVDTRDLQERDHVVYIDSFCPSDPTGDYSLIPMIVICYPLTPEQVNKRLSGSSFISIDKSPEHEELLEKMSVFSSGEKVIYTNNCGIYTLVPRSSRFRQTIMDGKNNIDKLFVDCMSDTKNTRGLVDIAFSIDDLRRMNDDLQVCETVNIDKFKTVSDNRMLSVLTNLVFTVPLNRAESCFEAFTKFEAMIDSSINYLIERYDDLFAAIKKDKLATFEGISSVKFRKYLCDTIPYVHDLITQPSPFWSEPALEAYKTFYADYRQFDDQERRIKNSIKMGIVGIVSNSQGDLLYTILTFKNKVEKSEAAVNKRNINHHDFDNGDI
jgi:hypothetical protein